MNDFLMRAGLPYRLFVLIAALVMGLGFAVPTPILYGIVQWWSLYVVPFTIIRAWRHGLRRGLLTPMTALVLVGILDPGTVLPLCLMVWLLSAIVAIILQALRFGLPRLGRRILALFQRRKKRVAALVTIAVQGQVVDVSAANILRQFGFGEA